ncbi:MAG: hypothetical protein ACXW2I_10475, partial [Burkholderiales bacterium]
GGQSALRMPDSRITLVMRATSDCIIDTSSAVELAIGSLPARTKLAHVRATEHCCDAGLQLPDDYRGRLEGRYRGRP